MRALVQRVREARVTVDGDVKGRIGRGYVILLGVRAGDTLADAEYLAGKCAQLRIFEDEDGKMNRALKDVGGSVLVVSQFTLYAETQRGNRPSFQAAARPEDWTLAGSRRLLKKLRRCRSLSTNRCRWRADNSCCNLRFPSPIGHSDSVLEGTAS